MGNSSTKFEKALAECPDTERYFGLENFGNTCYCNSVLQTLYFCKPFREQVLQYGQQISDDSDGNLLTCLVELFQQIQSSKKKSGVIPPKRFVQRLKQDNELFRSFMHQDAHEFLNYILNQMSEILEGQVKRRNGTTGPVTTWVHEIFQGRLVNQTKCLRCETVTNREEVFMDLSLEIDQNCSLTSCLKKFSATETLEKDDKFFCDTCCSLQEAQKRMKLKQLPPCLILHLKRFKYIESQNRMRKLMHRVVFPMELKLSNTTDDADDAADRLYTLFGVVVHVGSGPHHGHYVSLIKSGGGWWFFDDEQVESITEHQVHNTFGLTQDNPSNVDHGYILFYEQAPLPALPPAS